MDFGISSIEDTGKWLVLFGIVFYVGKWLFRILFGVRRLNNDPLQQELASLLLEASEHNFSLPAQQILMVSSVRVLFEGMITSQSEKSTRLAHALSMVKPLLSPNHYQMAKMIYREIAKE